MRSFVHIENTFGGQPPKLGAVLARIDVGRGREELYRDQVPELLRSLASQTRAESISASSAIEGVIVDPGRVGKLIDAGQPIRFRDRNEDASTGMTLGIATQGSAAKSDELLPTLSSTPSGR